MRSFSLLLAVAASTLAVPINDEKSLLVVREGSKLYLNGEPWKAVGPNVYWLGLDENVIPPAGQPFYEPTNASYPTEGRITEIMASMCCY